MNKGFLFGGIAVLIWSGFILVSRYGGIGPLLPYDIIAIRYGTCSLILLPVWLTVQRFQLLTLHNIMIGLVGGLAYALCVFQGFALTPASHAAILLPGLMPLVIGLLSFGLGEEHFTGLKSLSIALISFGVIALLWQALPSQSNSVMGYVWLAGGASCWALFSVLVKRWGINPWRATISLALVTSLFYLPVYILWLPKNIAWEYWPDIALQMVYQGILATIIQLVCYVKAVQLLGPRRMGSLMALIPIIAGTAATIIFQEPFHWVLLASLILVSCGVWLGNIAPTQPERNTLRQEPGHQ